MVIAPKTGEIVSEVGVNFGADLPHYGAPNGFIPGGENGEVHADPKMWLEALDLCLSRLKEKGVDFGRIAAISGAGQQHGTVYLNDVGVTRLGVLDAGKSLAEQFAAGFSRETSPIWMDTSTTAQCRAIEDAVGGAMAVCEKTGSVAVERFSGPQIRRFAEESADAYAATKRVHLVSSFIASVLAGADAPIDHGDGAGMNLLNLKALDWDAELLDATAAGLREKLPPVAPSGTVVGPVSSYFVEKYGFTAEAQVIAFTGDNPSSLVGMGASVPGRVVISLGTSDTFFAAMPDPLTDPDGCGHVFGNPLGGFMTLQCFLNGSLAREKVRESLGMDWEGFSAAVQSTPAGNDSNVLLPFFGPEISPRVDVKEPLALGAFAGSWQRDRSAARACLEGQFLNMRLSTAWMQLAPEVIYLTGGASANDAIAQIAADVFQAQVKRLAVSGSVALGGAMRAAITTGMADYDSLCGAFCKTVDTADRQPDSLLVEVYNETGERVAELRARAKG